MDFFTCFSALNSHYNSLKQDLFNKNKELDLVKKKLESTNQEHTQTSLEYKDILENFLKCEMVRNFSKLLF